jgi:hypothetical protein
MSETANILIMVSFGVLYGVTTGFLGALWNARIHWKLWDLSDRPRSYWVSFSFPIAILVLLFLTVRFTPVQMRWGTLLIADVMSWLITKAIFEAAKAGRFGSRRNEKEQLQAK